MERGGFASFGRRWHRRLDTASGALLLFLLVFAPWGAGGTLVWSSWVIIGTGWALGLLLAFKWSLTRFTSFQPTCWRREGTASRWPVWILMGLTILLLLQVAVSLWNARAEVNWTQDGVEFLYRDAVSWLPTTYDLAATRKAFFRYLAFAATFWAARDWLLIKSSAERHREVDGRDRDDVGRVPDRVRWLLWILSFNTAAIALVGILHRLDGDKDLLWSITLPSMPNTGMFGPYPYRANAAQFINVVWPIALGFWWALRQEALRPTEKPIRAGGRAYPMLLLCVALMVTGVIVAASRGGIAIALVEMGLALLVLGNAMKGWRPRLAMAGAFVVALALGWGLAGKFLSARFENSLVDETLAGRTEIFDVARKMGEDFPVWGSGAETFLTLNGLYRSGARLRWHGYVHDDWLETRITFGWVGFALVVAMLLMLPVLKLRIGTVPIQRESTLLFGIGLIGVLAHGRLDFPFQIPSIHLMFLVVAAVFAALGPVPSKPQ